MVVYLSHGVPTLNDFLALNSSGSGRDPEAAVVISHFYCNHSFWWARNLYFSQEFSGVHVKVLFKIFFCSRVSLSGNDRHGLCAVGEIVWDGGKNRSRSSERGVRGLFAWVLAGYQTAMRCLDTLLYDTPGSFLSFLLINITTSRADITHNPTH